MQSISATPEAPTRSNITYRAKPDENAVIITDYGAQAKESLVSFEAIAGVRTLIEENRSGKLDATIKTRHGQITVTREGNLFKLFGVPKVGPERLRLVVSLDDLDKMLEEMRDMHDARMRRGQSERHDPKKTIAA